MLPLAEPSLLCFLLTREGMRSADEQKMLKLVYIIMYRGVLEVGGPRCGICGLGGREASSGGSGAPAEEE